MASDKLAASLFERMLRQTSKNEREASYNYVMQQEIVKLEQAVDDVAQGFASFAHNQQISSTVEESQPLTGGQAASLMVTIYSTLALHQELEKKLEKVTTTIIGSFAGISAGGVLEMALDKSNGLEAAETGEKEDDGHNREERNKYVELKAMGASDIAQKEQEQLMVNKPEENGVQFEEGMESESETEDFVVESDPNKMHTNPSQRSSANCEQLVKTIDDLLLHERAHQLPQVLHELTTSIQKRHCTASDVFTSLRFVVWWVRQSAGQGQALGMYRDFINAAGSYLEQLAASVKKGNAQRIERMLGNLSSMLDGLGVLPSSGDAELCTHVGIAEGTTSDKISLFVSLVEKISFLPVQERNNRMSEVLTAFKKAINVAARAPELKKIAQAMNSVVLWMMNDGPPEPCLRDTYRQLCALTFSTTKRMSKSQQKTALQRIGRAISKWLDGKDVMTPQEIAVIQKRVTQVKSQVEKWQVGAVSLDEIDSVMVEMQNIVRCSIIGWSPKNNPTLCECAIEVEKHVKRISVWKARQNRIVAIAKWGLASSFSSTGYS